MKLPEMNAAQLYRLADKRRKEEESAKTVSAKQEFKNLEEKLQDKIPNRTLQSLRKKWNILEQAVGGSFKLTAQCGINVKFEVHYVDFNFENLKPIDYGWEFDECDVYEQVSDNIELAIEKSKQYRNLDRLRIAYEKSFNECVKKYKVNNKKLEEYIQG